MISKEGHFWNSQPKWMLARKRRKIFIDFFTVCHFHSESKFFPKFAQTVLSSLDSPIVYSKSFPSNVEEWTVAAVAFFLSEKVSSHNNCKICRIFFSPVVMGTAWGLQNGKPVAVTFSFILQFTINFFSSWYDDDLYFLILRVVTRLTAGYKSNAAWGSAEHHTMKSKKLPFKLVASFTNMYIPFQTLAKSSSPILFFEATIISTHQWWL